MRCAVGEGLERAILISWTVFRTVSSRISHPPPTPDFVERFDSWLFVPWCCCALLYIGYSSASRRRRFTSFQVELLVVLGSPFWKWYRPELRSDPRKYLSWSVFSGGKSMIDYLILNNTFPTSSEANGSFLSHKAKLTIVQVVNDSTELFEITSTVWVTK